MIVEPEGLLEDALAAANDVPFRAVHRITIRYSIERLSRQPDGRFPAVLAVPAVLEFRP